MSPRKAGSAPVHPSNPPARSESGIGRVKRVSITWPGLAPDPDDRFSADEGPTDRDLFAERDGAMESIAIYEPSSEGSGEGGISLEPEQLGRAFLRDAVQQQDADADVPIGFQTDELDLETVDWDAKTEPDVAALDDFREKTDLDLSLDVIHDASLFDQPTDDEDDAEATRAPRVRADDSDHPRIPERAARRRS